jgi:hypothetical protein
VIRRHAFIKNAGVFVDIIALLNATCWISHGYLKEEDR